MATISLQSYTLYAGEPWGPVQVTITDTTTTYQSCVARLIMPFSDTPDINQGFTNITLNTRMVATATPNVFTLTINQAEMNKLLTDSADPTQGIKHKAVQVLAIAYAGTATPNPLTDSGTTLKSEEIAVFLTGRGVALAT